jgi:AraC family transcriptional regulator, arabinose operon regulatory protein
MQTNIGICGYSYHTQRFYSQFNSGFHSYLFRLQTEGKCTLIVNDRKLKIEKGDLTLIHPGDQYELIIEAEDQSCDYFLICDGDWVDKWWQSFPKPTLSKIDLDDKLISLWRHIIIEERRPLMEKNKELSDYLVRALCLSLERAIHETISFHHRPNAVTRMMRFIEEHSTTSIKVEEVARHAGLSVSRAVHLFKEIVGKTIIEYTQEIRLAAAIDRMKYTSMTLEQIAENCGFGTYSYFHRVFHKKYGVSPGAFRRME